MSGNIHAFMPFAGFGMVHGDLEIVHIPTSRAYRFQAVVIREHDLVPCALYGRWGEPMWVRPLTEILHTERWEWAERWNPFMSMLAGTLAAYEGAQNGQQG
jgi:hypothetical protein